MREVDLNQNRPFICCGMYAFSTELQNAWQALFDQFLLLEDPASFCRPENLQSEIAFDASPELMNHSQLYMAHTCGYPLMKFYNQSHEPVCVPVFNVEGVAASQYSSRVIVHRDSSINKLADSQGNIVSVNGEDSNSGMNVLRHAISELANGDRFFSSVIISGGHWQSMIEVVEGRADIAAVDCVSYALLEQHQPELCDQCRTIQWTQPTTGLPFVTPKNRLNQAQKIRLTQALNEALAKLENHHRENTSSGRLRNSIHQRLRGDK